MPEKHIARLQCVQNCLARVVTKAPRFYISIPILKRLHWLSVKSRFHFKVSTITFRTLKYNQPAYLADLLVRPKYSKYLRSTNSSIIFVVPRIKRNAKTILTSRELLKSHLFYLAFPPKLLTAARLPVDEPASASFQSERGENSTGNKTTGPTARGNNSHM